MEQALKEAEASRAVGPAYSLDPETLYISPKKAAELGRTFAAKYQSGSPYHHIAIDDFLPMEVAWKVREEALLVGEKGPENSSPQEHLKASYNPDELPDYTRLVFTTRSIPNPSSAFSRR
jgi:hypothetical protein